jgi:hypothetical protein
VQDRLDAVVGCGGWAFDWTPLHVDAEGNVQTAKGTLTVLGIAKSDVGVGSNFEASKGCVSDCLKRCAVMFGVARYLYGLPIVTVTLDADGKISEATLAKLREGLSRRAGAA